MLIDAVYAIEAVGGIWLGMSAIAFILLAIFVEIRKKSAAIDAKARRDGHVLDLVAKTEKKCVSKRLQRVKPPKLISPARSLYSIR